MRAQFLNLNSSRARDGESGFDIYFTVTAENGDRLEIAGCGWRAEFGSASCLRMDCKDLDYI